jgi:hypothetical protein
LIRRRLFTTSSRRARTYAWWRRNWRSQILTCCHPFRKQPIFSTLRAVTIEGIALCGTPETATFILAVCEARIRGGEPQLKYQGCRKSVVDVRLSVEKVQLTPAESFKTPRRGRRSATAVMTAMSRRIPSRTLGWSRGGLPAHGKIAGRWSSVLEAIQGGNLNRRYLAPPNDRRIVHPLVDQQPGRRDGRRGSKSASRELTRTTAIGGPEPGSWQPL